MAATRPTSRRGTAGPVTDDRVLRGTRWLSAFIAPFLLVAFVLLYLFPGDTQRLWAWTITPTMTPMTLAAAYLGGAYFFIRALREPRWSSIQAGLPAVFAFASLLGVATVLHWDRFNHPHPAFWLWTFLYATAPFLVAWAWWANRRYAGPAAPDEERLGFAARVGAAVVGVVAFAWGVTMFAAPAVVVPVWPWALTPLTCRVLGAIFCLGFAGVLVAADPRWVTGRLMSEVAMVMLGLILVAAVRAWAELALDRPLTWVFLGGETTLLVATAVLRWTHARTSRAGPPALPVR
jgi:hypothetical protein